LVRPKGGRKEADTTEGETSTLREYSNRTRAKEHS